MMPGVNNNFTFNRPRYNPAVYDAWVSQVPPGLEFMFGTDYAVMYEHGWDALALDNDDNDHLGLLAQAVMLIDSPDVDTLEELRKIVKQMDLSLLRMIEEVKQIDHTLDRLREESKQ